MNTNIHFSMSPFTHNTTVTADGKNIPCRKIDVAYEANNPVGFLVLTIPLQHVTIEPIEQDIEDQLSFWMPE